MDARPESKAVTDTIESKETTNTQPKSNDTDIIGGDEGMRRRTISASKLLPYRGSLK